MQVVNEVVPQNTDHVQKMLEPGPEGPVFMVNLLKFKDRAEYADGRETSLSGREAYSIYGKAVADVLPKFGGGFFMAADATFLALGQVEELWDEVAIAVYPERSAMVRMSMAPDWQEIGVHRAAGLAGQLNIETVLSDRTKQAPWMKLFLEGLGK